MVEGAEEPEANRTYKRCQSDGLSSYWNKQFPVLGLRNKQSYWDKQFPVFSKGGLWEGNKVNFFIYRLWYNMRKQESENFVFLYYAVIFNGNAELPPKSEWRCMNGIPGPALHLKW